MILKIPSYVCEFVKTVLVQLVPPALLGCWGNFKLFLRKAMVFITLQKAETFSLHQLLQGFTVSPSRLWGGQKHAIARLARLRAAADAAVDAGSLRIGVFGAALVSGSSAGGRRKRKKRLAARILWNNRVHLARKMRAATWILLWGGKNNLSLTRGPISNIGTFVPTLRKAIYL